MIIHVVIFSLRVCLVVQIVDDSMGKHDGDLKLSTNIGFWGLTTICQRVNVYN